MVVTVARPVEDSAGRLLAVIAVGTLLERFQEALRVQGLPAGSVVRIVNEKGIVIARSVDGPSWIGRDLSTSPSVARHLAAKETSDIVVWSDGVERITGSATAHTVPWLISVGLPTEIAFAEVARRLGWAALFISGTLMAAFAIAWMLSGRIVRPLRQLGRDAAELAAGKLGHRSAVHTHDEVGTLADNFNRMAVALERRQDEARAAADQLQEAKDTLAAVIDAAPVAIACSSATRELLLWSRGAEKIFGYRAKKSWDTGPGSYRPARKRPRRLCSIAPTRARPSATCRPGAYARTARWSTCGSLLRRRNGPQRRLGLRGHHRPQERRGATAAARPLRPAHRLAEPAVIAEGAGPAALRQPPRAADLGRAVRPRRLQGRERYARAFDR